ncbi:SRPBCC family protein [Pontixanthobacter sp. CEM42]|uniref:SRPBCC family protein n=1 Tax=Pontixanthobacter sp. CEM42 TaxID=2792077 RepID=UPI001ADF715F|nr:SRPBCC family protein [Pontixanthobacter sp. CEM42]
MRKFSMVLAGLAAAVALPAQAKVVELEESAFVTRDTKVVSADLREAWLALTQPGSWWNSAHTFSGDSENMMLTPQAGGCFCERIPENDTAKTVGLAGSVKHMSVILAMPDQALRMEGALGPLQSEPVTAILTVTLAKAGDGTRITFEYAVGGYMRFEVPGIAQAVDGVMSQQLGGLAELLGEIEDPDAKPEPESAGPEEEAAPEGEVEGPTDTEEASGDEADEPSDEEPEAKIEPKITVDEAFGDLVEDQ